MRTLWAASFRHLLRHPAQLILALTGLALGVATITAVDTATSSSARAFSVSIEAVNGAATHQIVGGPQGIDEQIYLEMRTAGLIPGLAVAPVVEGYLTAGGRSMQLLGLDPLASPELGGSRALPALARQADDEPIGRMQQWFTHRGTVILSATTAQELGLAPGDAFELNIAGRTHSASLLQTISREQAGYEALIMTDIAQAQEWLGLVGRLSRIDVRLPDGAAGESAAARIRDWLPTGLQVDEAQRRERQNLDMTAAFTTNLQAMSLLALLVSVFLIYSAISFAVVQRRRTIGILRALGATRSGVLAIILTEAAALGVVGAGFGLLLGLVIGRELIALVSRTINDFYFVVAVNEVALPPGLIVKAVLAGFSTSLVAAALPAAEVAHGTPQLGIRRSTLETKAVNVSRWLLASSAAMAVAAGLIVWLSGRSLFAGFVALCLLLLSVAAATPAVLRALARIAARLMGPLSPVARLAFGEVAASLSRTGVAVAALGMAVALMIGVSVMVESFHESLREWLARTVRADIYVTAPGPGFARPERRLETEVIERLLATPGMIDHSANRRVVVESNRGPIPVDALRLARQSREGIQLTEGEPVRAWRAFEQGAILVSEPLAWRLQLHVGEALMLTTAQGPKRFEIAGIYREYGNNRGNALMSLAVYRDLWRDEAITGLGLYLDEHSKPADVIAQLRSAMQERQALLIRSSADIRQLSMQIFERTFRITRVLYWLAAGVAAIGLISALLAWELERSRELAIVRSLGLTPRGTAALIAAQTLFMGFVSILAAIPAGLLTAILLVEAINRRAFGWQLDLHVAPEQFGSALLLAMSAALVAALYPAWRSGRAPIATDMRDE